MARHSEVPSGHRRIDDVCRAHRWDLEALASPASFPAVPLGGVPNWILSLVHPEGGPRRTTP